MKIFTGPPAHPGCQAMAKPSNVLLRVLFLTGCCTNTIFNDITVIHYHLSWICLLLHEGEFRRGGLRSTVESFGSIRTSSCLHVFWCIWLWVHVLQCLRYPCLEFHLESSIGELSFFIYFVWLWLLDSKLEWNTKRQLNSISHLNNKTSFHISNLL